MSLGRFAFSVVIIGAAMLHGCQQGGLQPSQRRTVTVNGQGSGTDALPTPPIERTLKSDPCAARLHEISGAMLEYFAFHNALPKRLEDLQTLGDLDRPLSFVCPVTGRPYTYIANGLRSKDDTRQIIVFDTVPDALGQRWAIMMQPAQGRSAAAMWVLILTEQVFTSYVPISPVSRPSSHSSTER
jgi:hypothetical protein